MNMRSFAALATCLIFASIAGISADADEGNKKIANVDPVEVGKVGIGTRNGLNSEIKQSEALVIFEPMTNQASIGFKSQSVKYKLYLSEKVRSMLIEAAAQYKKEYDERSLNLREKKTTSKYGSITTRFEWGFLAMDKYSMPKVSFGYVFVDRHKPRPYFTISLPSATNLGEQVDDLRSDDESISMVLYLTKNQVVELGELLMQEKLEGILKERGIRDYSEVPDPYFE